MRVRNRGFTLTEMLVVLGLMVILSAGAVLGLRGKFRARGLNKGCASLVEGCTSARCAGIRVEDVSANVGAGRLLIDCGGDVVKWRVGQLESDGGWRAAAEWSGLPDGVSVRVRGCGESFEGGPRWLWSTAVSGTGVCRFNLGRMELLVEREGSGAEASAVMASDVGQELTFEWRAGRVEPAGFGRLEVWIDTSRVFQRPGDGASGTATVRFPAGEHAIRVVWECQAGGGTATVSDGLAWVDDFRWASESAVWHGPRAGLVFRRDGSTLVERGYEVLVTGLEDGRLSRRRLSVSFASGRGRVKE